MVKNKSAGIYFMKLLRLTLRLTDRLTTACYYHVT